MIDEQFQLQNRSILYSNSLPGENVTKPWKRKKKKIVSLVWGPEK